MRIGRQRRGLAGACRRAVAGMLMGAYLAAAIGLPLPARPPKDTSVPFPCQDNACGCCSAEECWQHCCCYTPAEQLAWARAHRVEPPAGARCLASEGWDTRPSQGCATSACCERGRSCCRRPSSAADETPTCCRKAKSAPTGSRWSLGTLSLRCRGLTNYWVLSGITLPPAAAQPCQDLLCGWVTPIADRAWTRPSPPRTPPPRRAAPAC